jgi:hypothetical protein
MNANVEYIPNHLVWSILATLFCCLPLGIVSIVYASQVDGRRLAGDIAGARELSHKAKMWAIYAAIAMPVLVLGWIVFFGGLSAMGALLGNY